MFIIPCKFNRKFPFIIDLVQSIRKFHPTEKIVVVDSCSNDKSYFMDLISYDVTIMENNPNWCIGAYWMVYKKFPNEDYYYCMHDSMKVKDNLDSFKEKKLTTMMYFDRNISNFNSWGELITKESKYAYKNIGNGCYGPMFFCKNEVLKNMMAMGADKFLPTNKQEIGYCEGCYGFFLEEQEFKLQECALFGDVIFEHSIFGRSGVYPHNTSWQFPIEKFYGSHLDINRNL